MASEYEAVPVQKTVSSFLLRRLGKGVQRTVDPSVWRRAGGHRAGGPRPSFFAGCCGSLNDLRLIRLLNGHLLPSPGWPPHCLAICPLAFSLSSMNSTIAWKWPLPLSFTAWDSLTRQSEDESFTKYPPDHHGQGGGGPRSLEVKGFDQGHFELWCWRRLLRVHWTARRSS